MRPKTPIIDVLIVPDGDGWRLYSAPSSWRMPFWPDMNERGDVFPVGPPDMADLDQFMRNADSPFDRRFTAGGGLEILAKGRSAVTIAVWLQGLIDSARR